jgi:hypothetical protein
MKDNTKGGFFAMKLFKKTAIAALATILSMQMLALAFEGENPTDNEPSPVGWYISHTGVVAEIEENEDDGLKKIALANSSGEIDAYFYISGDTLIIPPLSSNATDIEKGVEITGYVPSNRPMIMIYPPQYSVDVATFAEEGLFSKADLFDSDLVSGDKTLKLNLGEDTEIYAAADGKLEKVDYTKEELANKKLLVNYDVSTRSIPAITTPKRIVVLPEEKEPVTDTDKDEAYLSEILQAVPYAPIVVGEDTIIKKPNAYAIGNEIMVPVRAVSEALGYTVGWDDESRSVTVGDTAFTIGEQILNLPVAAELKDGFTYVPLKFFTEVLGLNNAYFFEGQIHIDNFEKMQ